VFERREEAVEVDAQSWGGRDRSPSRGSAKGKGACRPKGPARWCHSCRLRALGRQQATPDEMSHVDVGVHRLEDGEEKWRACEGQGERSAGEGSRERREGEEEGGGRGGRRGQGRTDGHTRRVGRVEPVKGGASASRDGEVGASESKGKKPTDPVAQTIVSYSRCSPSTVSMPVSVKRLMPVEMKSTLGSTSASR